MGKSLESPPFVGPTQQPLLDGWGLKYILFGGYDLRVIAEDALRLCATLGLW